MDYRESQHPALSPLPVNHCVSAIRAIGAQTASKPPKYVAASYCAVKTAKRHRSCADLFFCCVFDDIMPMMKPGQGLVCAGCKDSIKDKKYIACTSMSCKNVFHHLCVNYRSSAIEPNETWICPVCKNSIKKVGDNSATPVRSSENVTVRKPRKTSPSAGAATSPSVSASQDTLVELTQEIRLLREEVSTLKSEFKTVITALNKCEQRLEDVAGTVIAQEARLSVLEAQASCVDDLKAENEHLKDKINQQSQEMLRNDVEIHGLTEDPNENPLHILVSTAAIAGISLNEADVDFVKRVGPKRANSNTSRPLVARFSRRSKRDEFAKAVKARRPSTADVNIEGPTKSIYVNERLTPANRLLFRTCRAEFKEAGFKYCWTMGGRIFVKQREGKGEGSETFTIERQGDISRILQKVSSGQHTALV